MNMIRRLWSDFIELWNVFQFQEKFGVPMPSEPTWPGDDVASFRFKFLREELRELEEAYERRDMKAFLDALVDLEYVLKGTVSMFGLHKVWPEAWAEVQRANMAKQRAKSVAESAAATGRASKFDVIKPPGWIAPDHTPWLGNGPWPEASP